VRNHTARIIWALIFALAGPVVWACSACVKDILSAEEFDQSGWDHFENVYVGLVTRAELSFPDHSMPRVTYSVVTEERCSASRVVDRMNSTVRRESADTLHRLRVWRDTP
jgi:hypothetical protein